MTDQLPPAPSAPLRRAGQRGFTLIELTVVMAITAVMAVLGARLVANEALEATGEATAAYLNTVRGALDTYLQANYVDLSNNTPIAGYANALAPTISELRAGGHLIGGFPLFTPFNSTLAVQVIRTSCPGASCRIDVVAHQVDPLLDAAGEPMYQIAGVVRQNTVGGLAADFHRAGRLAGPTGDYANPLGTQGGAIGVTTSLNTATYAQFVRRFDDRLTTLNEALTVNAGPLATGGVALTVNGSQATTGDSAVGGALGVSGATTLNGDTTANANVTVNDSGGSACVTIDRTGVVTISCTGTLNARTGQFTDSGGNTSTISPSGVDATGTVRGAAGLSTASATLFDSTNPDRITVTSGQMFVFGSGGQLMALDNGDVVADRNVSGDRLALRGTVAVGAACANTSGALSGGASEFAALAGGGLAVCSGGRWVSMGRVGAYLGACTGENTFAVDGTTNETLVCKSGNYAKAGQLLSGYVMVQSYVAVNGSVITKPTCPNAGTYVGQPLIFLVPGSDSSTDGTFNRSAQDTGASWTINLPNGGGTPSPGNAIAQVYCWYAGIN